MRHLSIWVLTCVSASPDNNNNNNNGFPKDQSRRRYFYGGQYYSYGQGPQAQAAYYLAPVGRLDYSALSVTEQTSPVYSWRIFHTAASTAKGSGRHARDVCHQCFSC